jgi:hypothetical protein
MDGQPRSCQGRSCGFGVRSADLDNFFKISNKLLFIMKPTLTDFSTDFALRPAPVAESVAKKRDNSISFSVYHTFSRSLPLRPSAEVIANGWQKM